MMSQTEELAETKGKHDKHVHHNTVSSTTEKTETFNNHEPEKIEGTIGNRQCRDVGFLIVFVIFIAGMGFSAWRAYYSGNPLRIIYGTDSWGNICNQKNEIIPGVSSSGQNLINIRYLYFFNSHIFNASTTSFNITRSIRICVKSCPSSPLLSLEEVRNFTAQTGSSLCKYGTTSFDYASNDTYGFPVCPPIPISKQQVFLNRCVPESISRRMTYLWSAINSILNILDDKFLEKAVSDVTVVWVEIIWLCGLSVGIAFTLVVSLQFVAGYIIWFIVVAMILGTVTATFICWYYFIDAKIAYDKTQEKDRTVQLENRVRDWLIGASSVTVLTVIVLVVLLVLRRHIRLVVELFRQAGKAIMKMPFLLLQPILTLIILTAVVAGLGFVFLFVETAGSLLPEPNSGFAMLKPDEILKYMKWYYIFGFIWIFQFIMACHKLTVSGAVAIWYFTRDKSELCYPVLMSIKRVVKYHLGSLALGSLLVTFIAFIRLVLSFIEKRLRNRESPVAVFCFNCFQCCFRCFENFIQFLDANAYVEIAIYGYGFCLAARKAFRIIVANALRLAAINSVGDFVLFLGKVATVSVVIVAGIQLMSTEENLFYFWLPTALAAVFAYFIASCFMSVYETTIDTIFVCFCEDSLMNDGKDRPYFMNVGLMNCMSARLRS